MQVGWSKGGKHALFERVVGSKRRPLQDSQIWTFSPSAERLATRRGHAVISKGQERAREEGNVRYFRCATRFCCWRREEILLAGWLWIRISLGEGVMQRSEMDHVRGREKIVMVSLELRSDERLVRTCEGLILATGVHQMRVTGGWKKLASCSKRKLHELY